MVFTPLKESGEDKTAGQRVIVTQPLIPNSLGSTEEMNWCQGVEVDGGWDPVNAALHLKWFGEWLAT
ncbi:hypothetical protein ACHAPO_003535 [Fusarium lateritium]